VSRLRRAAFPALVFVTAIVLLVGVGMMGWVVR
jgi:hypothetical protein